MHNLWGFFSRPMFT